MRSRILGFKLVKYITCQLVFMFMVLIIPINAKAASCILNQNHRYASGTLDLSFQVGTSEAVTWNAWLEFQNTVIPLLSIQLPAIATPITVPIPIPGFPSIGKIGFYTSLVATEGVICSTCTIVDTSPHVGPTIKLPDTGQTLDFTSTYGEDSDYTINPPSYTNNSDGTVTDNNTNLMWQMEDDNVQRNWNDAISYCSNLFLAGHSDWRLSDYYELLDIVNYGNFNPAIDSTYFPNTNSSGVSAYWSSTTCRRGGAWKVAFYGGEVYNRTESDNNYVRCVRGGQ